MLRIDDLEIENRVDRVTLTGDVVLTRDKAGLALARQLQALVDGVVKALGPTSNSLAVWCRDEVDVHVRHGLAGSSAIVDADVLAIGPVLLGNQFFCPIKKRKQRSALKFSHLKERADMALGNDQAVSREHRVAVENQYGMHVLLNISAEIIE